MVERKAMIDREHKLSIKLQAKVLGIGRGTAYSKPRPVSRKDLLRHVSILIKKMGIETIDRRPNMSKPAPRHRIDPYWLSNLAVKRPNQYIPMARGFVYQQGSVQREKRRSGLDVWIYRWYETGTDGKSKYRKAIVGTVVTLANQASALKAAQALRIDANHEAPHTEGGPKTVAELISHYRLKELAGEQQGRKAFSTRAAYECYLKAWVLPRWGTYRVDQVKPVAVEAWLDGIKRANGTKAKIRNLMSAVFQHAMRYEWMDRNPIQLVRQSAKREKVPDVLELAELQLILTKLAVRERTLALLDAATGLRVSELLERC